MIGAVGARRASRARRGSSPNVQPGHNILQHAYKHQKGQTLLNVALLDEFSREPSEGK